MILYIGIAIAVFVIAVSLFAPSYKYALLAVILARPVVDATWEYQYSGFGLIHLFNGAFILIFLFRLLLKKDKLYEFPYFKLIIFYTCLLIFAAFHISINSGIVTALDFFFKSLFMPAVLYLFFVYFDSHKDGKLLTTVLIISGLFPISFIFLQIFTGHIWVFRESRGLTRVVGLYHDSVSTRIFLIQILIGIFIYWHYFLKKEDKIKKLVLSSLFFLVIFGLYHTYSKAIIVTLILWLLMIMFLRRKVYILPVALIFVLLVNTFSNRQFYSDIDSVFSSEIDYVSGELATDRVLSGRGMLWRIYFSDWEELPVIRKVIGDGVSHAGFHNEYLRILFSGGILLMSFFIVMVSILSINVIYNYQKSREFIHFAALLCIVYFFVESLGTVPGLYPNIQTFVWGIVGLSLSQKLQWNENDKTES